MILPKPVSCASIGDAFTLPPDSRILWRVPRGRDVAETRDLAELLAEYLRPATGWTWPVAEAAPGDDPGAGTILLEQTGDPEPDAAGFRPEAYTLETDAGRVRLAAESPDGLARAIQALRQLFPAAIYASTVQPGPWTLPAVRVEDAPRFPWRGLMLDTARHFFSVETVKRFIELIAQHRMSVFHWHLTDDQGWRLEIKKYPRLTEVGSIRKATIIGRQRDHFRRYDRTPYGGFYTQEEIRDIVAFAARRHVTIVPEVDMPGHMAAAIAAYPELGNGLVRHPEVRTMWGISDNVLNVEASTVQFCQDVWSEVMALFPGKFLHLGGDECPRKEWTESPRAQALMAERGLTEPGQLQAWFTRQMDDFFRAHGRRLIGWHEILDGHINPSATIMVWWDNQDVPGILRTGHDIVMATNKYLYLDYYQREPKEKEPLAIGGLVTLEQVYGFDPAPADATGAASGRILGGQGQLWTEYIATPEYLEYMAFPRGCAVAEILWTPREAQAFGDFQRRLQAHVERLRVQQVRGSFD